MKKIRKKLRSTAGESIAETLSALLVIVLALTMLAGSIVSAARVNRSTADMDTEFVTAKSAPAQTSATLNGTNVAIDLYTTESGYLYYSPAD